MISAPGLAAMRGALGALDLLELVDRRALAVLAPADALREQVLNVGFGHNNRAVTVADATVRCKSHENRFPWLFALDGALRVEHGLQQTQHLNRLLRGRTRMYRIIGGDGKGYGPVAEEPLRPWARVRNSALRTSPEY